MLLFVFNLLSVYAQNSEADKFLGKWYSGDITMRTKMPVINAPTKNVGLKISLILFQSGDTLHAKMQSPDSKLFWTDANKIYVSGDSIKLYFDDLKGIYTAELNEDRDKLYGSLNFLGKMISVGFKKNNNFITPPI